MKVLSPTVYEVLRDGDQVALHIDDLRQAPPGNEEIDDTSSSSSDDSDQRPVSSTDSTDSSEEDWGDKSPTLPRQSTTAIQARTRHVGDGDGGTQKSEEEDSEVQGERRNLSAASSAEPQTGARSAKESNPEDGIASDRTLPIVAVSGGTGGAGASTRSGMRLSAAATNHDTKNQVNPYRPSPITLSRHLHDDIVIDTHKGHPSAKSPLSRVIPVTETTSDEEVPKSARTTRTTRAQIHHRDTSTTRPDAHGSTSTRVSHEGHPPTRDVPHDPEPDDPQLAEDRANMAIWPNMANWPNVAVRPATTVAEPDVQQSNHDEPLQEDRVSGDDSLQPSLEQPVPRPSTNIGQRRRKRRSRIVIMALQPGAHDDDSIRPDDHHIADAHVSVSDDPPYRRSSFPLERSSQIVHTSPHSHMNDDYIDTLFLDE